MMITKKSDMTSRPKSTCTRLLSRPMASTQAGCSEESFGSRLWIASVSSGRRVILCRDYVRSKYIAFIIIVVVLILIVVLIIMASTCMGSIRKECMAKD